MQGTTIQTLAGLLLPGHPFEAFLEWPPDLFALTSLLLKRSGAYRLAVAAPSDASCRWPEPHPEPDKSWNDTVNEAVRSWYEWLPRDSADLPSGLLGTAFATLQASQSQTLASLRSCKRGQNGSWDLCRAVLTLHAIADTACAGLGLPSVNRRKRVLVHHVANQLLVDQGTLSRVDPMLGIVVPKMRTPQSGMTLRSMSHHVTFHETEVQVNWRTLPWLNRDEHTINVLVVPLPRRLDAKAFSVLTSPGHADRFGDFRYFSFKAPDQGQEVARILGMIEEARRHVRRVHIVVLPEAALTRRDLEDLKVHLASLPVDQIPLIVSGRCDSEEVDSLSARGRNDVVLSSYFASKWYDLEQSKHHRWKLDEDQVRRYELAGVLTGGKNLWEGIELPARSFSVLAPNGWLALAPLVCEDLAQQEPLAEITRGIGPTVLVAVLLDGPQLDQRWSARYASVLADDPGTSILTVTSLGMATRSKGKPSSPGGPGDTHPLAVAMWKDRQTGLTRIGVEDDAVLLSLSATRTEEFTADGRTDYGSAAVVELRNTFPIKVSHTPTSPESQRRPVHASNTDFEEISTLTYLANSLLAVGDDHERAALLALAHQAVDPETALPESHVKKAVGEIARLLRCDDRGVPREAPGADMVAALDELTRIVEAVPYDEEHQGRKLGKLVDEVENRLDALDRESRQGGLSPGQGASLRARIAMAVLLLWAAHERLASCRRHGSLTASQAHLLVHIEKTLEQPYDKAALDALVAS